MKKTTAYVTVILCGLVLVHSSQAVNVSVFDDPVYVDTTGGFAAESDTVQASLGLLGHTVNPFSGISSGDFSTGLTGADVLLIPQLENAPLGSALSGASKVVITSFVSNGGRVVIHGGQSSGFPSDAEFLNEVFGFSITTVGDPVAESSFSNLNVGDAAGTTFASSPSSLQNFSRTHAIASGLPVGSKSIYTTGVDTTVALVPYGAGNVIYLGWEWFNAVPIGTVDGGWLSVLDAAVLPEPASLSLFALSALTLLKRRKRT